MAEYQGKLDALCGMYAICNALELCGAISNRVQFEDAWDEACAAIPKSRLHEVLRLGTKFSDIQIMINRVRKSLNADVVPKVSYPFSKKDGVTDSQFRNEIKRAFEDGACCCLVSLNFPHKHWLVGEMTGSRIVFTDSARLTNKGTQYKKNFGALLTGSRKSRLSGSKWVIDRREFAIFWKAAS